jgi:hypothetical protein
MTKRMLLVNVICMAFSLSLFAADLAVPHDQKPAAPPPHTPVLAKNDTKSNAPALPASRATAKAAAPAASSARAKRRSKQVIIVIVVDDQESSWI